MANGLKTEHPHIVRIEGVCGGEPVVDGLRVTVRHVATLHRRGDSILEIAESLGNSPTNPRRDMGMSPIAPRSRKVP
jgi:uncharacterized protein (DUF433 family)